MSSMAPFLLLLAFTVLTSPTISTSMPPFLHRTTSHTGFRTPLKHIDSGKNLTRSQILDRAIVALSSSKIDIKVPATPTTRPSEFFVDISIGTPPLFFSALMDTGSDLLWTQCQPCIKCFPQTTPIYDPKKSSSYIDLKCNGKTCEYEVSYGDGTYTKGFLANETFTFGGNKASVPIVAFGCGTNNTAKGGAGTVGLGRGPFAIVQQFDENRFAYCLTTYGSNDVGFLAMGSLATVNDNSLPIITTPILDNPSHYYVSLEGITVGNTFLPINQPPGTQGTGNDPRNIIVDSGATVTSLEKSYFQQVADAFINQTALPQGISSGQLKVCFIPPSSGSPSFPKLIFHFKGADELVLPQNNYIFPSKGNMCLGMRGGGATQIFGNYQQQNTFVLHDLDKKTISFVPTQSCDTV